MTLVIQPPRVEWVLNLLQLKLEYVCDLSTARVQFQEKLCYSWVYHVDCRSVSSSTYITTIGKLQGSSFELGIIINFNNPT
jgi:hypothetical protein